MPRSNSKSKTSPFEGNCSSTTNRSPPYEAPPSSPMPPIATLNPDLDCGEASLNQKFPLSSARDEPGTKPMLEPFVFVPIPSPPPKRGKKSQSRKSRRKPTADILKSRLPRDQENIPRNSSSTSQIVAKERKNRRKIQVPKSLRVLRSRHQLSVKQEKYPLDSRTTPSELRLTQGKENDEKPYWEVSWDKWTHVRGTIRRPK